MIKRIAVAAGIAALLATSAVAASQAGTHSPRLAEPVAVSGQSSVTDYLGGSVGAGTIGPYGPTAVATSSTVVSTSTQTTQAVEQQVSDGGCSSDCGLVDEPADVELKRADVIEEDDPRWDCHTMGNRICGPGHG